MFEQESQSYYEILDVKPDASQNEIRQAYFRAKAAYGKDSAALYSLFDADQTRQVLDMIEQAYLVLSNPEKRKEYDKVHGFLKATDMLPTTRKQPAQTNVFTFAKPASEAVDPAQAAANNVFGSGAESVMGDVHESAESGGAFGSPAAAQKNAAPAASSQTNVVSREQRHEDYSTPRTLASHGAAGPPVQDYVSSSSFNARENKLGIVRRIDLAKPYDRNPGVEEEITRETAFRGDFFRKIREYKSISVEELAEFTKISKSYINCIESEEFESLPAPAYLRGFIIQISKALKLPHDKAANAYMLNYKNTVLK